MKRHSLALLTLAILVLFWGTGSWAVCPEAPLDNGWCDTLNMTCLDGTQTGAGPYLVRFPLLVSHDVPDPTIDSIGAFVFPFCFTHTNPAQYCSASAYWNASAGAAMFGARGIFRHLVLSPTDTMYNWMKLLYDEGNGEEWNTVILNMVGGSHFWLSLVPTSTEDRRFGPGIRVLITTMTLRIQDTMHVDIDSCLWPPSSSLMFSRNDGQTYIPRHNLPHSFWIGPPLPPACQISPDSLKFGTLMVGDSLDKTFNITNTGGGTLTGTVSEACADYDLIGSTSYNLTEGQSQTLTVRFKPTSAGSKTCTIETGNNACVDVNCTGTGESPPACLVSPDSLKFGTVLMGDSLDKTFRITNTGGGTLSGTVSEACADYGLIGSTSYNLTSGQSQDFTVRFKPTSVGLKTCSIETGNNACVDVSCTGTGDSPPACLVSPDSLKFGTVTVGDSLDKTFTITNTGGGTLSGTVSEACADYGLVGSASYSLTAGQSDTFTVRFKPTSAGLKTCTIETGNNACVDVSCTGTGELPPVCLVDPDSLKFGTVMVGDSLDKTFTITNTGGGTLSGTVSEACADYGLVGSASYSLTAGQSDTFTVRFKPTSAGLKTCTIETGNNACVDVSCTGTGELPPDFTIKVEPDTQEVQLGDSVNSNVILTSLYGFASPCSLSESGLPAGAAASFNPNPVTPTDTSVMTVSTTAGTTPLGTYNLTITARQFSKAQVQHSIPAVLRVTYQVNPDTQEVQAGDSVMFEVDLSSLAGLVSSCTLTVSGLPSHTTYKFNPNPAFPPDTSILTIYTETSASGGTYELTITATGLGVKGPVQYVTHVVLIVHSTADFTIHVIPDTLRLPHGQDSSYTVTLDSINGFSSPCSLEVTGLPFGASGTFDSTVLMPPHTTKLKIHLPVNTDTGFYTLTVTATQKGKGKEIQHSYNVTLVVTLGTWAFYIDAHPDTQKVVAEDSTQYHVVLVPNTGFSQPCTLSLKSGLPAGASCRFDPVVIAPHDSSLLTINCGADSAGIYKLVVKGTANPRQTSTDSVTLIVQDFAISATPDSQIVIQGQPVGYQVKLTSLFGFKDTCTLLVSGLPNPPDSGVFDKVKFTPTDSTLLNVYTSLGTDTGWYNVTITAQKTLAKNSVLQRSYVVHLHVMQTSDAGDWVDNSNAPKTFTLFQNQPNPFNPETKISYYLPKASQVKLTIYNVLGQKVRTLFDGLQETGVQTLTWNGKDDNDRELSSGIYFYRLQADNYNQTRKMSLLK